MFFISTFFTRTVRMTKINSCFKYFFYLFPSGKFRTIVSRKKLLALSGLKETTLKTVINSMVKIGLLTEITGYSRNQAFAFERYINLFRD